MKYIVIAKELETGVIHQMPIIFPDNLVHKDVAHALGRIKSVCDYQAVRAGFVQLGGKITVGTVTKEFSTVTYGESETLGKKSDPNDAILIDTYQYTGGMT